MIQILSCSQEFPSLRSVFGYSEGCLKRMELEARFENPSWRCDHIGLGCAPGERARRSVTQPIRRSVVCLSVRAFGRLDAGRIRWVMNNGSSVECGSGLMTIDELSNSLSYAWPAHFSSLRDDSACEHIAPRRAAPARSAACTQLTLFRSRCRPALRPDTSALLLSYLAAALTPTRPRACTRPAKRAGQGRSKPLDTELNNVVDVDSSGRSSRARTCTRRPTYFSALTCRSLLCLTCARRKRGMPP